MNKINLTNSIFLIYDDLCELTALSNVKLYYYDILLYDGQINKDIVTRIQNVRNDIISDKLKNEILMNNNINFKYKLLFTDMEIHRCEDTDRIVENYYGEIIKKYSTAYHHYELYYYNKLYKVYHNDTILFNCPIHNYVMKDNIITEYRKNNTIKKFYISNYVGKYSFIDYSLQNIEYNVVENALDDQEIILSNNIKYKITNDDLKIECFYDDFYIITNKFIITLYDIVFNDAIIYNKNNNEIVYTGDAVLKYDRYLIFKKGITILQNGMKYVGSYFLTKPYGNGTIIYDDNTMHNVIINNNGISICNVI